MIATRSALARLSLSALLSLALLSLTPSQALGIQGTPLGLPGTPTILSVSPVSQPNPDVNSDTVVTWKAAVDGSGHLIDGSTPITGYTATVMSGANFETPIAASCTVPPNNAVPATVFACTITGLGYGKTYKIEVVANNVVGSSLPALSSSFTTPSLSQTVTISGNPGSRAFVDPAFSLTASTTSGLLIAWSTPTPLVCTVGPTGAVGLIGVGTCTITATQDGAGSHYSSGSASVSFAVTGTPSGTPTGASALQATGATLNALVPYPGVNAIPTFCISTTNSISGCPSPAGISIGASTPAVVTATSSTAVSAIASGLQGNTTYYYWVKVTAGGATAFSPATATFHTLVAPSLNPSGGTTPSTPGVTSGIVGQPLSLTVSASSGSGVYSNWSASSLPTGLTFTPGSSSATISGIPALAGDFTSRVSVTDDLGVATTITLSFSISDPAHTPSPAPSPSPTPTATPGTLLAHVDGARPAVIPLPNFSPTSVAVIAQGDPKSVRGVLDASVLDGVLTVTPLPSFSGKILLPVTITSGGVPTFMTVLLTVNPAAVSQSIQVPKSARSTTVTWATSPNATGYQVFVNGKLLCTTATTQCGVPLLLGPNAKVEVSATGGDGTFSITTATIYAPDKPIEAAAVNFAANKSILDAAAKKTLLTFVTLIKTQGFSSINIVGHLDSKTASKASKALAIARAKATATFLAKYLKVSIKIVPQGAMDLVASNKTKTGQAANRRAALLVS